MVDTDPVTALERTVARAIGEAAAGAVDCAPSVHVHFRDSTIVYVLDCDSMPAAGSELTELVHRRVAEALEQVLGRRVAEAIGRTRLSETSVLVMLRLR